MAHVRSKLFCLMICATAVGCSGGSTGSSEAGATVAIAPQGSVREAAENEPDAGPQGPRSRVAEAARVEIPGGKLISGSTPGDTGRDAILEPALVEVELGAFTIDRHPYPNDPTRPPMTNVSRSRAAELCQERGERLCTELEWERACKGPENATYASGASWDPACAKDPGQCASAFGVAGMGAAIREWTASDVEAIDEVQVRAAAVRGARGDSAGPDHRCSHRTAVDATASGADLGFRCCGGPPNAATIASPKPQQTYRRADIPIDVLAKMLSTVKELSGLSKEPTYFKEPDDTNLTLARADAGGPPPNTTLTTSPLLWSPVPGEEILVVAGRAEKDSFIVAFYRLPGDAYRVGSSFLMKNDKGPIALGFNGYVKRKILWGTCWDCPGESGQITYREDGRVVITQK